MAADVFALGCVLFRCLSGRTPFEGRQHEAVLAKIAMAEGGAAAIVGRGRGPEVSVPTPSDQNNQSIALSTYLLPVLALNGPSEGS